MYNIGVCMYVCILFSFNFSFSLKYYSFHMSKVTQQYVCPQITLTWSSTNAYHRNVLRKFFFFEISKFLICRKIILCIILHLNLVFFF